MLPKNNTYCEKKINIKILLFWSTGEINKLMCLMKCYLEKYALLHMKKAHSCTHLHIVHLFSLCTPFDCKRLWLESKQIKSKWDSCIRQLECSLPESNSANNKWKDYKMINLQLQQISFFSTRQHYIKNKTRPFTTNVWMLNKNQFIHHSSFWN